MIRNDISSIVLNKREKHTRNGWFVPARFLWLCISSLVLLVRRFFYMFLCVSQNRNYYNSLEKVLFSIGMWWLFLHPIHRVALVSFHSLAHSLSLSLTLCLFSLLYVCRAVKNPFANFPNKKNGKFRALNTQFQWTMNHLCVRQWLLSFPFLSLFVSLFSAFHFICFLFVIILFLVSLSS